MDLESIHYYFDAQDQDAFDRAFHSQRSAKIADIHRRLLTATPKEFEHCYETLAKVLADRAKPTAQNPSQRAGHEDYAETVKAKMTS